MTGRISDAEHAFKSAMGNLYTIQELATEARQFDGPKAGLAVWQRNAADCRRWVAVVVTAGKARLLPSDLLNNRAFFNAHDWRIPCV